MNALDFTTFSMAVVKQMPWSLSCPFCPFGPKLEVNADHHQHHPKKNNADNFNHMTRLQTSANVSRLRSTQKCYFMYVGRCWNFKNQLYVAVRMSIVALDSH